MAGTLPHTIIHVRLDDQEALSNLVQNSRRRYYVVFWWRQIPLGDSYLQRLQTPALKTVIIAKLQEQLSFYTNNAELVQVAIDRFENSDFSSFSKTMDQILQSHLLKELPEKLNISVVVCTRNRSMQLKKCLDSLLKQFSLPKEIIVVDNAPLDEETRKVCDSFAQVTYHKEPRPGLDIARNTGARLAQYPVIAYTDDDVVVDPFWSYRVWQSFQNPKIAALTGLVIAASLETESQQIFEEHWGFNKGYKDIYFDQAFLNRAAPAVWVIGAGANMAFRKSLLDEVGYFDERLDVGAAGCSGDSEIWYRILAAGFTIQYNPRAVVYHEHRPEISALHRQLHQYMRGFAVASLIQHGHNPSAGYKNHLYIAMPRYYLLLLRAGFPTYKFRYRTLWSEIKGLISGIRYYHKTKNISSLSNLEHNG